MVYTADSAALAVLEVRVHLDLTPDLIPKDFVLLEIQAIATLMQAIAPVVDTPTFGDTWLEQRSSLLLMVPSVIVPESSNILINPEHPEAATAIELLSMRPFAFDSRLWRPTRAHDDDF